MNPNYNHTITLYNCLRAEDTPEKKDIWYRHVLRNCFYKNLVVRGESDKGVRMTNAYTVRIPESSEYKQYHEWAKLPEELRALYFTLRTDDIVLKGECRGEITGVAPHTAAQVLNMHKPDAFRVTAISDNTNAVSGKHYRLGG